MADPSPGRRALTTGASSGIRAAGLTALAAAGSRVIADLVNIRPVGQQ